MSGTEQDTNIASVKSASKQSPDSAPGSVSGRGLFRSSAVVSAMTMISRVLGLARDMVFARVIGADGLADAFFVAFKIPNFLRRLFAEGAFSQAFVPVLSEYRQQGSHAAVRALIARVSAALGSVLLILTILAVTGAPVVTAVFAPGFLGDEAKFAATSAMIRVTFPYILFISLTGLVSAILNSYDRFAVPAFTPVWLNVCLIGAALVATPWFAEPVYALAWGVFAAGIVQFVFQLPFLARLHLMPRPVFDWKHEGVRRILKLMVPALFGVSVSQINLLLDTVIASFLPEGSVSWLYYSDRLVELPLGVFGVAAATVILPRLSRQNTARQNTARENTASQNTDESPQHFNATLDWGLRFVLLIAVPASIALIIIAEPVLVTLFYDGDGITQRDIYMAAASLRAYAVGLIAFMCIKVLVTGYFSRQDTRTPVRIGVIAMVSNMILNIALVIPLHYYFKLGHTGLALATSLAAVLNAILLLRGLLRAGVYRPQRQWLRFAASLLVANAAMAALLLLVNFELEYWLALAFWTRMAMMLALCAAGGLVYCATLFLCGMRPRDLRADSHRVGSD